MNHEPRTTNQKILVADDSPTVRNVAESLLRKHGYEVLLAEDGAKALEIAKRGKPDLILLDHSMPVINGEQVLKELKESGSLKEIRVIMLLSKDEIKREQELRLLGADDLIVKPLNCKEVLDHIENLLHKEATTGSGERGRKDIHTKKEKPKNGLEIIETSDLMENFELSIPDSEQGADHGFEWFLSELQKETAEEEKPEQKKKDKVYEIDAREKGYEDFLHDLRSEFEESESGSIGPDKESPPVKSAQAKEISRSEFDKLIIDLKEKISEKIAQEVAKKISPELLEKIIRDETSKLLKHVS